MAFMRIEQHIAYE